MVSIDDEHPSPDSAESTRRGGRNSRRKERRSRPLDRSRLRDLALSYVARFATTGAKLENYLARKIRERGVADDTDGRACDLDVSGLVSSFIEAGYIDDDAYARARSRDLTGRGYGARRVEQALRAAGVEDEVRCEHAPGEAQGRRAAILLARKRRFGPFAQPEPSDDGDLDEYSDAEQPDPLERRKLREKQVAAMLRAGHSFEHAAFVVDAARRSDIEDWLKEAEADEQAEEGRLW